MYHAHNIASNEPERNEPGYEISQSTDEQKKDLLFAWTVAKHVKSNAIVLVKDNTLLGIGAGQPNRYVI